MKKLLFTFIILTTNLVTSQHLNQETFQLNIEKSVINWKGTYAFQFSEHQGTVNFSHGILEAFNGKIVGGYFEIDMTSILYEDGRSDTGPVEHLMNSDFFYVKKFPKAQLKVNTVTYFEQDNLHKMEGDLTIKGISHPIEFWATANAEDRSLKTRFKIDRRDWGITYNHKLKNNAISNAIEFEVELLF